MPSRPLRYCAEPGCSEKVTDGRCPTHSRPVRAFQRRFQTGDTAYNSARWVRQSRAFKAEHPFCLNAKGSDVRCTVLTEVVDHIVPHRGDSLLFWDMTNWQPLCRHCHAIKTGDEVLATRTGYNGGVSR